MHAQNAGNSLSGCLSWHLKSYRRLLFDSAGKILHKILQMLRRNSHSTLSVLWAIFDSAGDDIHIIQYILSRSVAWEAMLHWRVLERQWQYLTCTLTVFNGYTTLTVLDGYTDSTWRALWQYLTGTLTVIDGLIHVHYYSEYLTGLTK